MVAHARPGDPETSHQAADQVTNQTASQKAVLTILEEIGPLPHHRITHLLRNVLTESRARTAVKELRIQGLVRDSGRRTTTPTGRKAVIWEAIP